MKWINFSFNGKVISLRMGRIICYLTLVLVSLEVKMKHDYEELE